MTSKIDNSPPVPPLPTGRAVSRADGEQAKEAASSPASEDSLELSGEATKLASTQSAVVSSPYPYFDRAKIDTLRMAVASGAYKIRPEEIAARLMALEREIGR